MYVSLNWLKTILTISKTNLKKIKEKLIVSGFEVEEIKISKILNKKDVILNLKTTTNRSDLLNIAGLTNEIKTLLNIEIKNSKLSKKNLNFHNCFSEKFIEKSIKENFSSTVAFISIKIENIHLKKIQPWIQKRLLSVNFISENNLNDLRRYCMLEWGQPIFIYDLDKIKNLTKVENSKITVRFAKMGETFIDSNNKKYLLTEQTLLVTAEDKPISIAGISISKDCLVDKTTKNIFVEFSIFNPKTFRNSERSLGLRTETSIFYERGINKFLLKPSFNRFLKLLFLINKNSFSFNNIKFCFNYLKQVVFINNKISISFENIKKILENTNVLKSQSFEIKVFECLRKLNFNFYFKKQVFYINVPFTRYQDIEEEIDLIEEISRLYGFNNFESIVPKSKKIGKLSKYENLKRKFRDSFINLGFLEICNYSLISENLNTINVINPLINDYSSLRTSLLLQLLKTLERNISQGNKILPIFEIGHNFEKKNNNNSFFENELICGVFGGNHYRVSWSNQEVLLNWFQARAFLEIVFKNLDLEIFFKEKSFPPDLYHSKNCLIILCNNQEIGIFGKINPKFCFNKRLPKNCFLFELDLVKILKIKVKKKVFLYESYSLYPASIVDLSLSIPKKISFQQIVFVIEKYGKQLIEKIELFDVYDKFEINSAYYSLGLKLSFRSYYKTFLKIEIDKILFEIKNKLKQILDINIRT